MEYFAELIEDIKKLSFEELEELNHITRKYLIELEREKLLQSHLDALEEYKKGDLKFSSDIKELKKILNEA